MKVQHLELPVLASQLDDPGEPPIDLADSTQRDRADSSDDYDGLNDIRPDDGFDAS